MLSGLSVIRSIFRGARQRKSLDGHWAAQIKHPCRKDTHGQVMSHSGSVVRGGAFNSVRAGRHMDN